jgi:hypothetical protein
MVNDWNNLGLPIILSLKSGMCNTCENISFLEIIETISPIESAPILVKIVIRFLFPPPLTIGCL